MPDTLLPKKATTETPIATDDIHHAILANDPAISQFPQGSIFGAPNAFNIPSTGPAAFGSTPATGLGYNSSTGLPNFQTAATNNFSGLQQQPQQQPILTQAGSNAAQDADVLVQNDNTDWINKKWRPAMGWVYMLTCTVDFVLFPILWSILQALSKGNVTSQWQPLTLQGAGLYHIAMGAVLGIAAYGRTKEKIEGASK